MDTKKLATTIFTTLLPFLKKSKSIQQVSKEVLEATDTTLSELWQKVKPIFIEEFEVDTQLTEEATDKGAVMHVLKKALTKNEALKQAVTALLEEKQTGKAQASTVISDSENVVAGNTITTGRDFHVGDNNSTTNHIGLQIINVQQVLSLSLIHISEPTRPY